MDPLSQIFLFDQLGKLYNVTDENVFGGALPGGVERKPGEEPTPPIPVPSTQNVNPVNPSNYPSVPEASSFPVPALQDTGSTQKPGGSRISNEEANRKFQQQLLAEIYRTSSPEFLDQQAERNLRIYGEKLKLAEASALAKSREKSQRELELENIRSWKEIERAQIMRDTIMATQLAQTAYIAGTPNASVLSALGPTVQQTMAAFKGGQSVFPGGR
jgi:hypothetical protein